MPEQVLDAVAQRRGRGWAAGTGTFHIEINNAVLEAAKGNVAAVIGDRRPHPRLDQILDLLGELLVCALDGALAVAICYGTPTRRP